VLRNRADANSSTIRKNILDWYKSTLYTRLAPGGCIVFINTRWHQDDLAGYLLQHEPESWTHINMPAISDDGHSLWPERWPLDKLEEIKKSIGSYEWSALYQQSPAPQDGGMFNKAWFEIVNAKTVNNIKSIRYWDRAATVKKDGNDPDWTVGVKMSKTKEGLFYIEDVVRLRASSLDVQKAIHNTAVRDGTSTVVGLEQDPGSAGKSEVDYLTRMLSGFIVKTFKVTKDKVTRASPFSAQCEAGNVRMLKASWNNDLLEELSMFPFSKNDDQTDAASGCFNYLTEDKFSYESMVRW
jgi:predicted phage terminase large subunit-like protein